MHLVHFAGAASICLGVNCLVAVVVENSHYRGIAGLLVMILFGGDAYSYLKLGKPVPPPLYGILGLGAIGLIIHSMEPGVFTKDKKAKTKAG
jgi:hypothetical protein